MNKEYNGSLLAEGDITHLVMPQSQLGSFVTHFEQQLQMNPRSPGLFSATVLSRGEAGNSQGTGFICLFIYLTQWWQQGSGFVFYLIFNSSSHPNDTRSLKAVFTVLCIDVSSLINFHVEYFSPTLTKSVIVLCACEALCMIPAVQLSYLKGQSVQ